MALVRVKIENYRSIKKAEIRPPSLCALVRENNAGKSNILRAIQTVLGRDWVTANSFADDLVGSPCRIASYRLLACSYGD